MLKQTLLATALAIAPFAAEAVPILSFGQETQGNTVTVTEIGGTSTTLSAVNVPVTITQILGGGPTISPSQFNLSATSVGSALQVGSNVIQRFSGSFSVGANSVNYLSGTFTDSIFGSGTGLVLTASNATPGESVTFTSDVIPIADLQNPLGVDLTFISVNPPASLTGTTISSFSAAVTGSFSADEAVNTNEPASLALLGIGLLGLGFIHLRKTTTAAA